MTVIGVLCLGLAALTVAVGNLNITTALDNFTARDTVETDRFVAWQVRKCVFPPRERSLRPRKGDKSMHSK